ncbi:hypothetical protein, partial [Brevibacterium casei]|uniref:hypothetical protein n=1 Tax=Brevibacterium casei TaxID=33889 RepID=UPI001C8FB756
GRRGRAVALPAGPSPYRRGRRGLGGPVALSATSTRYRAASTRYRAASTRYRAGSTRYRAAYSPCSGC